MPAQDSVATFSRVPPPAASAVPPCPEACPDARLLADIQRMARIGIWEHDHPSARLRWTDEIFSLFEVDPARFDVSYEAFLEAVHPDDRAAVDRAYRASLADRRPYGIEHRLRMPDGRVKWVRESCETSFAEDGAPLRSVGVVQDVTAQKEAEEARRQAEDRQRVLLDAFPESALLLTPDGVGIAANRRTLENLRITEERFVGHDVFALLPPAAVETRRARIAEVLATGREVQFEDTRYGRNILNRILPVRDGAGAIAAVAISGFDVTALRRAEASLRESEARYRLISENATDVIFTVELPSRTLSYASPSMRTLRGFTPEEALEQTVEEMLTPESLERVERSIARTLGRVRDGEALVPAVNRVDMVRRDGTTVPVEVTATPVRDADGGIRVVCIARDISERKRFETELEDHRLHLERLVAERTAALEESEERYRILFHENGDAMYMCELDRTPQDCRILEANDTACRLWGIEREDVVGSARASLPCLRRSIDPETVLAELHAAGSCIWEETFRAGDGAERTLEISSRRIQFQGRPVSISVARDITRRRTAEEELRRASALSDAALGLTRSGYWIALDDGRGEFLLSERAVEILGLPSTPEFRYGLAADWLDRLRALDAAEADRVEAAFEDALAGRTPCFDAAFAVRRPQDGRIVHVHAIAALDPGGEGRPSALYGAIQDVTAQVALDRELQQAMEAAQAANRAKSAFLSNMSHEIRTPMNAVLGFTQLALSDPDLTARQRGHLSVIARSGEHLLSLINEVLEMSRIEAGRTEERTAAFDLRALAADLEDMFRLRVAEKGIALDVDVDPTVPACIVADEGKVKGILINLLGNAVKFTRQGGVALRMRVGRSDPGGSERLSVEVEDSGVGIPDEDKAHLFEPFYQTRNESLAKGGTGLGLSIARSHARVMGGDIAVADRPGGGSVFALTLPLRSPCTEAEEGSSGSAFAVPAAAPGGRVPPPEAELPPERLEGVAHEDLECIREAARAARIDDLLACVDNVSAAAPRLAARLRVLAVDYRYEAILAMLRRE